MTRRLSDEVGAGWVHRYAGALTPERLDAAAQELRANPPAERPNLDGRDPGDIEARYAEVFRAAAAKAVVAGETGSGYGRQSRCCSCSQ